MTRVSREQDVTVIEFGPSYDSLDENALEQTGDLLLAEALGADPPRLLLDLSETSFIGSSFIELLVRAWKRLKDRGGTMALCGVQPFCKEVLQITRLDTLWEVFPDRPGAVDFLAGR
jgi:anti-anti-sigma factor